MKQDRVKLGQGGRIVIPADLRTALGVGEGDELILIEDDGAVVLTTAKAQWRKVQQKLAALKKPGESVVDDFIAERRAEAARE
jgi:AbrB family looped-hinge helix DNA binding protein